LGLFLFVIMLLDLKEEERRKIKVVSAGIGSLAVVAIAGLFLKSIVESRSSAMPVPFVEGTVSKLGTELFTRFLLPFEIVSVLLLVAMIGVILLSKKDLK
jgi:NADH-quinone oxidoreductase subunit J